MSTEGREQDLLDWVAGELSAERKERVDAHLLECAECRSIVRDLQSLSAGLDRLSSPQLGSVDDAVARGFRATPNRGRSLAWLGGAAAAVLVLVTAGLPLLLEWGPQGHRAAEGELSAVPALQLRELDAAIAAGRSDLLTSFGGQASSAPVRLVALTASPPMHAAGRSDRLAAAFAEEQDELVRLWLIVEVARAGDSSAALAIRRSVDGEDAEARPEVRAAAEAYLSHLWETGGPS